ncbi:MAG: ComF family protein [Candidatus Sumerlaeales bacterium]|nr:ComF family protein [Candidatus Sumerlaeales bacterium]
MMNFKSTIHTLLKQFFYTLSPPICVACGNRLPEEDKETPLCPDCLKQVTFLRQSNTSIGIACYHEGPARTLIHQFKYRKYEYLARFMAQHMSEVLPPTRNAPFQMLIPVPLWKSRQRDRGFNQAELLTKELLKITGIPSYANILIRTRNTPTQTALSRKQRKENVKGAFAIANNNVAPALIRGAHILLVDDVCTTGATLDECAFVLKKAGAMFVSKLVFASPPYEDFFDRD